MASVSWLRPLSSIILINMKMPTKGPYPPAVAGLGGQPNKNLDDPVSAVFLVLFIIGAVFHMTLLQINQRRGKKFLMSGMLFGFCMVCPVSLWWS